MTRALLFFVLLGLPAPTMADVIYCELPWFARNLIFDRAGNCFSSPLGRATFDNTDCTGTDITLSQRDRAAVDHIEALEQELGCAIDTSQPRLEHAVLLDRLRVLEVIPAPVEHESGCIGYAGAPLSLHTAPAPGALVIGRIEPGDDLGFAYLGEGGWEYVLVWNESEPGVTRHGWAPLTLAQDSCEMFAG